MTFYLQHGLPDNAEGWQGAARTFLDAVLHPGNKLVVAIEAGSWKEAREHEACQVAMLWMN
jgi:hypothetical protein